MSSRAQPHVRHLRSYAEHEARGVVHHPDMAWCPDGVFTMGSDRHFPEEAPAHRVSVSGFWMDVTAVTNEDFARFVRATGYLTVVERSPATDRRQLAPGGQVFSRPRLCVDLHNFRYWLHHEPGACWRCPEGPGSSLAGRFNHPVVHIAYEDALAYARWAGKDLPTEAEWEYAARGGLEGTEFAWGDELTPGGRHMANLWQGDFPLHNLCDDGFEGTAPARSYPENAYGLYQMIGNVWEWTSDWYQPRHTPQDSALCTINPRGPSMEHSYDPRTPGARVPRKVLKGGSFLCSATHSRRYRPAARMPQRIDLAACHVGFRCVLRTRDAPAATRMLATGT